MPASTIAHPAAKPAIAGLFSQSNIHYQCSPDELVRATLEMGEGALSDTGALVVRTGAYTGRSPKDKFTARDLITAGSVHWNDFNLPINPSHFHIIREKISSHLSAAPRVWVRDCYACADPRYRLNIRVVNEKPWGDLFTRNMFLRPTEEDLENFEPEWTVLCAPTLMLEPAECGTRQANAAVISFQHRMIVIAGTGYTGEIKKGIFTVLNYLLPHQRGVLSMHCSANIGEAGDTALFFGLSGTGKTTLSADPFRKLIGDDEHGWSDDNIFNFEGGCYAKTIQLSAEKEPEIFGAVRPGALVENMVFVEGTNRIDFSSASITENTRVSYPLNFISNAQTPPIGNVPANIFFLSCDAYGILPPVSRLDPDQAMYQFISGYTAKIAGTEAGVTEPVSAFSACFGAPFLPLHPGKYAAMLGAKMKQCRVKVWLINTGWTGGGFGTGSRIQLGHTRAMIRAVLQHELDQVPFERHAIFGMQVPVSCPGVPRQLLRPRDTWADPAEYDRRARELANKFIKNFQKYADGVDPAILAAGPAM